MGEERRGRRVEEVRMVSVARRERRRGRVGGCGIVMRCERTTLKRFEGDWS